LKAIFFAPHPDDETFACGGTIALKVARGEDVLVVVMTDGRNSHTTMGIDEDPTPDEIVEMRARECREAMSVLGVKKEGLIFLGFEDLYLYDDRAEAVRSVSKILSEYSPAEVFIPARNEFHPDHISTNLIVTRSIESLGIGPSLFEYNVISTGEPRMPEKGTVEVDVSGALNKKKDAVKVYKSQIDIISVKQRRPVVDPYLIINCLKNKETFLRIK
jgi:LmbE family N-acetylglucosaminyl deacetylase